MPGPAPVAAPPACGCGAEDDLIPVTDPDGSRLACRLCVQALVGSPRVRAALLIDVAPSAGLCQWLCGAPECRRSGCQNR